MDQDEDKTHFRSAAPPVSGMPMADRNMQLAVEAQDLQRLVPSFYDPEEAGVDAILTAKDHTPDDVTGVSFTMPEVVELWFNAYVGAEPAVNFTDIVRGIGSAAFMLPPEELDKVKGLVEALAVQIQEGSDPPQISGSFAGEVKTCLDVIFGNNEPISYRSLLAFTIGAFWLLGFVDEPKRKRGRLAPVDFVSELIQHYARLAYLPT